MGAEMDLVFVDGEMRHAATKLEEGLARVAVPLVLPNGVLVRLLGQPVLQFEGENGETVDKESDVQCSLALVPAVAELTRCSETVQLEALFGFYVLGRWGAIE